MKTTLYALFILTSMTSLADGVMALGKTPDESSTGVVKQKGSSTVAARSEYSWYDGKTQRKLYLAPDRIVEFSPTDAGKNALKRIYSQAQEVPGKHGVARMWDLKQNISAGNGLQQLKQAWPDGKFSQVLYDGPGGTGQARAIPGNIVIFLNPEMSQAQSEQWLRDNGLELVKKLDFGSNLYVVKSQPGLETLVKSNNLVADKDVVSAQPDWWRHYDLK